MRKSKDIAKAHDQSLHPMLLKAVFLLSEEFQWNIFTTEINISAEIKFGGSASQL